MRKKSTAEGPGPETPSRARRKIADPLAALKVSEHATANLIVSVDIPVLGIAEGDSIHMSNRRPRRGELIVVSRPDTDTQVAMGRFAGFHNRNHVLLELEPGDYTAVPYRTIGTVEGIDYARDSKRQVYAFTLCPRKGEHRGAA